MPLDWCTTVTGFEIQLAVLQPYVRPEQCLEDFREFGTADHLIEHGVNIVRRLDPLYSWGPGVGVLQNLVNLVGFGQAGPVGDYGVYRAAQCIDNRSGYKVLADDITLFFVSCFELIHSEFPVCR